MHVLLYYNIRRPAIAFVALRCKIRDILCLLGGSRQDVAFSALKAAVFPRACPASSDHPAHETLLAIESRNDSTVPAG